MTADTTQTIDTADGSWKLWTLVGIAAIWVAVLLISLLAPDLVSGSEHEHLPLPAFTAWLWGLIGTFGFLFGMNVLRGDSSRRSTWTGLAISTVVVWVIATVLAISMPVFETGTDPTELPMAALVAPLAAAVLTGLASVIAGIFGRPPGG